MSETKDTGQAETETAGQAPAETATADQALDLDAAVQAQADEESQAKSRLTQEQLDILTNKLKTIDTFRLFSDQEIRERLLPASNVRVYKASDPIIQEGMIGTQVFFIINGHVKVIRQQKVIAQMQRRGDVFGEAAATGGAPHQASVVAFRDTTCLVMNIKLIDSIQDDAIGKFYSILYRVFAEKLAERLKDAGTTIIALKDELCRLKKKQG